MKARYLQGKVGIWVSRESRPTSPLCPGSSLPVPVLTAPPTLPSRHKLLGAEAEGRGGTGAQRPERSEFLLPRTEASQQSWASSSVLDDTRVPSAALVTAHHLVLPKIRVPLCVCVERDGGAGRQNCV